MERIELRGKIFNIGIDKFMTDEEFKDVKVGSKVQNTNWDFFFVKKMDEKTITLDDNRTFEFDEFKNRFSLKWY